MSDELGPDRVLPTKDSVTWKPDGCVAIRKAKDWPANRDTVSLPTMVKKQCELGGSQAAMLVKREGKWVQWTYKEYYRDICIAAKGFIALGLEPFHGVAILGFNSPEWFLSDIGTIFAGGFVSFEIIWCPKRIWC